MQLNLKELFIFISVYMGKGDSEAQTIAKHFRIHNGLSWRIVNEDEIFDISVFRYDHNYFEISEVKVRD